MSDYIKSNKEAWEEAFENRSSDWGSDVISRVQNESYPFFNQDTISVLRKYDLKNSSIAQFCCNNGRETLSLVKSSGAKNGVGFDIAENQIAFANDCAKQLKLDCKFIATNIYDIKDYENSFDFALITIGALCWFKDLNGFFKIIAKTLKKGGSIVINETHPMVNMLPMEGDEEYDANHPLELSLSYFEHEWRNNWGMDYIAGKNYESKTFIDYTHSLSEIMGAMCKNGIYITNFEEFDYDLGVGLSDLDGKRFPLSMIIEGKKI